jgi:hypothetical protein
MPFICCGFFAGEGIVVIDGFVVWCVLEADIYSLKALLFFDRGRYVSRAVTPSVIAHAFPITLLYYSYVQFCPKPLPIYISRSGITGRGLPRWTR